MISVFMLRKEGKSFTCYDDFIFRLEQELGEEFTGKTITSEYRIVKDESKELGEFWLLYLNVSDEKDPFLLITKEK